MERQGPPRLLRSSSSNVLWSYHTPPGRRLRCPIVATTLLPSGNPAPWAIPERYMISGPPIPRPTRSLPYCFARPVTGTHARARFRPAGLSVGRVGFAPTGRLTVFQEGITSFYSNGPALPGRVRISSTLQRVSVRARSVRPGWRGAGMAAGPSPQRDRAARLPGPHARALGPPGSSRYGGRLD